MYDDHVPVRNGNYDRDTHTDCDVCREQRLAAGRETLADRIARLRPYINSTRFALTEDDVRHDYETGRHKYAA